MERRIDSYLKIAEELANQKGGIELLKGAIGNTERLRNKGEPISERNLGVLENLYKLAKRAGKNADQN